MEEAASKRLLERNVKEDNGSRETVKEWEMSPASVSLTLLFIFIYSGLLRNQNCIFFLISGTFSCSLIVFIMFYFLYLHCTWINESSWSLEINLVFEWHNSLTGSFSPCGLFTQINSSICLLRGKIYDAMDNRPLATSSYKEALKLDVYCFEAFDLLTSHHMLTAQEGERSSSFSFSFWNSLFLCSLTNQKKKKIVCFFL